MAASAEAVKTSITEILGGVSDLTNNDCLAAGSGGELCGEASKYLQSFERVLPGI